MVSSTSAQHSSTQSARSWPLAWHHGVQNNSFIISVEPTWKRITCPWELTFLWKEEFWFWMVCSTKGNNLLFSWERLPSEAAILEANMRKIPENLLQRLCCEEAPRISLIQLHQVFGPQWSPVPPSRQRPDFLLPSVVHLKVYDMSSGSIVWIWCKICAPNSNSGDGSRDPLQTTWGQFLDSGSHTVTDTTNNWESYIELYYDLKTILKTIPNHLNPTEPYRDLKR